VPRIVCQSFVSLDGVINHLDRWHFAYSDGQAEAIALEQIRASDSLLMGKRTYEVYAGAWPDRSGEYPDAINAIPKFVVSTTLERAEWNNTTVIDHAPIDAIRALRQDEGSQILMHGYGRLAKELMAEGLLDELHLWVHPVLAGIGEGDDLILQPWLNRVLRLGETRTLDSGIVILTLHKDVR
jgi:dihydrofolate reductase